MNFIVHHGKCELVLKDYPDNHFDSVVTDPPYGISFMLKHWDYNVPSIGQWQEILRVLKPGGYLLSFGGSRTSHRMAVNIEDAGFEIRDTIMWLYGSGFPKSMDIAKAIDKSEGSTGKVIGHRQHPTLKDKSKVNESAQAAHGGNEWKREWPITAPHSDLAKAWEGWGTALKPGYEPIIVARKPPVGTIAENVKQFGVGGINIKDCRVPGEPWKFGTQVDFTGGGFGTKRPSEGFVKDRNVVGGQAGRWPANVIHDGSEEVVNLFPDSKGQQGDITGNEDSHTGDDNTVTYGEFDRMPFEKRSDSGSAARFFYCAKTSPQDRHEGELRNNHPTVKPTELMRYLVKMVTPKDGECLDPFCGSGSTGKACIFEGFKFVGIDQDADILPIAVSRMEFASKHVNPQLNLFE